MNQSYVNLCKEGCFRLHENLKDFVMLVRTGAVSSNRWHIRPRNLYIHQVLPFGVVPEWIEWHS